jgi:hypothetical protein
MLAQHLDVALLLDLLGERVRVHWEPLCHEDAALRFHSEASWISFSRAAMSGGN